jgi:hypothetical protein
MKLTLEEYQKAYLNMQNIIDDKEKEISQLKKKSQIKLDEWKYKEEGYLEKIEKYKEQIEVLSGVDIIANKDENAKLLQSVRILKKKAVDNGTGYGIMYSDFENIIKSDINSHKDTSSLSPKQLSCIVTGLRFLKVKIGE